MFREINTVDILQDVAQRACVAKPRDMRTGDINPVEEYLLYSALISAHFSLQIFFHFKFAYCMCISGGTDASMNHCVSKKKRTSGRSKQCLWP